METITLPTLKHNKGVEIVMNLNFDELNLTTSLITKCKLKNEVDSNKEIIHIRRGERKLSSREGRKEDKGEVPMIDFNQGSINKFEASNKEKRNEEEVKLISIELFDLITQRNKLDQSLQSLLAKLSDYDMDMEFIEVNTKLKEKNYETEMYSNAITGLKQKNKTKIKSDLFLRKTNFAKEISENADKKMKITSQKEAMYKEYLNERKRYVRVKEKIAIKKKRLNIIKKELADYYHQLLYGGIDFRQEGLVWIIKAIWNLDQKVEMSFFPPFLDKKSIDYLFRVAHKNIEIAKFKFVIEKEKEMFFKESITSLKRLELKDKNNDFFSTSLKDGTLKTKQQHHQRTDTSVNVNLKSLTKFFENKRRNQVDYHKLPLFIQLNALNQKKTELEAELYLMRRKEMKRLAYEFLLKDYQKKYDVNIEILIGALVGELGKDKELLNYSKYKKVLLLLK